MVNVKHKRCAHIDCESLNPVFDIEGGKGRYCGKHKDPGMVNVKNRRCAHIDCESLTPVFDIEGGKGRFCSAHKAPGMEDVKSKRCAHPDCTTRVYYGIPGHQASRCAQHRCEGMIRQPKYKCQSKGCTTPAVFGMSSPERCEVHKDDGQLNLVEKRCVRCNCLYILDRNGHCCNCDPNVENRTRLAKQRRVMMALDADILIPKEISTDKMVNMGECGKERPDRFWDLGTHVIVLEVDEDQHAGQADSCDIIRMVNISQSLGGIQVMFIRYNPDEFNMKKRKRNPSFNSRMDVLKRWLLYVMDFESFEKLQGKNLLTSVKLFFNDYDQLPAVIEWEDFV
jgi:hypothetical protein